MTTPITSPEQLAVKRRQLSQDFNEKMKQLGEIRKRKAFKIIELLGEHKTVSKAELYWQTTEDGQKEIELTMVSKGLIELIRSIKTEVEIKQSEAYNQY